MTGATGVERFQAVPLALKESDQTNAPSLVIDCENMPLPSHQTCSKARFNPPFSMAEIFHSYFELSKVYLISQFESASNKTSLATLNLSLVRSVLTST